MIVRVRKGLLDLAKGLGGNIIRLSGDVIRLMRFSDDVIRLIRLGNNIIRFIRLSSNIIRLNIKYWENLGCLITIKRL